MILEDTEADMLFGIEALEIQAKIKLADLEMAYYQQREDLMSRIMSASRSKDAAFDGAVRMRGLDPTVYRVDIGNGRIVASGSQISLISKAARRGNTERDWQAQRSDTITVRAVGDDTD